MFLSSRCLPVFTLLLVAAAQAAPAKPTGPPALVGWAKATTDGVYVAGGYFPGAGWQDDAYSRTFIFPGTKWSLLNLGGKQLDFTTDKPTNMDVPVGLFAKARSKKEPNMDAPLALALSATYADKAQPRLPRPQSLNQPLYAQDAVKVLQAAGLKVKTAHLTQLLRVDLDGDGSDEVLISAHSRPAYGRTPETKKGDYTLTAIRFVSKGKVITLPIDVEVQKKAAEFSAPNRSEFMSFADIDGDGTMEIILSTGYYEGFGIDIWKFDGQKVRRVLSNGWGV